MSGTLKTSKDFTEAEAVRALQRVANRWPASLGLFSWSGVLCVMRLEDGAFPHGRMNEAIVERIYGIRNDGGDPD